MKVLLLSAALVLATSTFTFADQNCADLTTQSDMNICAGKAYQISDAKLNKLYKQIQTRVKDDAGKTKLLVATQKAWISFRDAECKFSSSGVVGGSVYPFISSSCLDGMTQTRIKDLQGYLKCPEGDLDCPVPAAN